jgi:hypothetical protein
MDHHLSLQRILSGPEEEIAKSTYCQRKVGTDDETLCAYRPDLTVLAGALYRRDSWANKAVGRKNGFRYSRIDWLHAGCAATEATVNKMTKWEYKWFRFVPVLTGPDVASNTLHPWVRKAGSSRHLHRADIRRKTLHLRGAVEAPTARTVLIGRQVEHLRPDEN